MNAQRRFGIAGLGAAVLVVLAYVAFIRTATGQRLENMALTGARQEFEEVRQESLAELHEISMLAFVVSTALVMGVALLRRKPRLALLTALVMGASVVTAEVLKRTLDRPDLINAPDRWLNNSFPSGHMTVAVAIGVGAVLVAPYALRWLATILGAGYAVTIAQAVETAGWHRLSGVIGATFIVLAFTCLGLVLLARADRAIPFKARRLVGAIGTTAVLGGLGLLTAAGGLAGLSRLLPIPARPEDGDFLLAYTTTYVIGASVVCLAFLGLLWLIRPYRIDEAEASPAASS